MTMLDGLVLALAIFAVLMAALDLWWRRVVARRIPDAPAPVPVAGPFDGALSRVTVTAGSAVAVGDLATWVDAGQVRKTPDGPLASPLLRVLDVSPDGRSALVAFDPTADPLVRCLTGSAEEPSR